MPPGWIENFIGGGAIPAVRSMYNVGGWDLGPAGLDSMINPSSLRFHLLFPGTVIFVVVRWYEVATCFSFINNNK